LVRFWN